MKTVLLLKAGNAQRELALRTGDYERWFVDVLLAEGLVRHVEVVYANLGQRLPARFAGFDSVLMTGSPLSMTAPEPWMLRAGEWMLEAAERRIPVLGVCFGHQLLGHVLGGRVVRNPKGREVGSVEIQLTPEGRRDRLFHGIAERMWVNTTHEDMLGAVPSGVTVLAENGSTRVQAFAYGDHVRGVQFHPELSTPATRALLEIRREKLEREARARGQAPLEAMRTLFGRLHPRTAGRAVLRNFLEQF